VARQTRQQRRERRAQQQPAAALAGAAPPAAPPRAPRPTAAGGGEPRREPRTAERHGLPGLRFIRESWAELKKVEWPSQRQVITGTTVVLIACVVVGAYLYANDIVWKHVVQNFLLK
jgi:preprotein translocase subunit SecE